MKVSIVIPCYNEKNTIEKIIEAVRSAPIESRKIALVDDGSRDGTQAILKSIRLSHKSNHLSSSQPPAMKEPAPGDSLG